MHDALLGESMSAAYKLTELGRAQPGMVLAADLLDRQGQMLLPQGAKLTESSLASLARHGVDMLPLVQAEAVPSAIDTAAVLARLDYLFRKNDAESADDWATGNLRRYIRDYRLGPEVAQ
jgi:hypothetical protein